MQFSKFITYRSRVWCLIACDLCIHLLRAVIAWPSSDTRVTSERSHPVSNLPFQKNLIQIEYMNTNTMTQVSNLFFEIECINYLILKARLQCLIWINLNKKPGHSSWPVLSCATFWLIVLMCTIIIDFSIVMLNIYFL